MRSPNLFDVGVLVFGTSLDKDNHIGKYTLMVDMVKVGCVSLFTGDSY